MTKKTEPINDEFFLTKSFNEIDEILDEELAATYKMTKEGSQGLTILQVICKRGSPLALIKKLVDFGSDPLVRDNNNLDCIHLLFDNEEQDPQTVEYFLLKGCDPNLENSLFRTALILACSSLNPNYEIIEILLGHGSDVNAQDFLSYTCLHYLCKNSYTNPKPIEKCIDLILSQPSIDLTLLDDTGNSSFHYYLEAEKEADCRIIELFSKISPQIINQLNEDDISPFILYLLNDGIDKDKNEKSFIKLINLGADINDNSSKYGSPLHICCCNYRYVDILLTYGASPDIRNEMDLATPLHYLCMKKPKNLESILQLFIKFSANLLLTDDNGYNIAHYLFDNKRTSLYSTSYLYQQSLEKKSKKKKKNEFEKK